MGGIRIGSVAGIDIRIDWSWLIIFFLILWTFTSFVFPANFPGSGTGTYIAMGAVGTLLFFGSILAHELAHSLVSQAKGIDVPAITLFVFGGISHTEREAETPGDEFWIAVVGPLTSLAVGALWLVFIGWFLRGAAEASYRMHRRQQQGEAPGGDEERPGGRRAA